MEDVPASEYLKVQYDIAEGKFKGYYRRQMEQSGIWYGDCIKSYKQTALPYFKEFIAAIEDSNKGFKFDGEHEKTLERKWIGIVLGEEEYPNKTGEIKTRLKPTQFLPVAGGKRNKAEAARFKAEGVKHGVPDLCLPVARAGHHGLYIEMKRIGQKPRADQVEWMEKLYRQGYMVAVCQGWEPAAKLITWYLNQSPSGSGQTGTDSIVDRRKQGEGNNNG